jgi:predicted glycogen debranching enzyme
MIEFGPEICGSLDAGITREWLETNGLGGFACSSIAGVNTRRYHGLLTAALHPPVGRTLLLAKLEETLVISDPSGGSLERRIDLGANEYPGVIHPQGYQYLKHFALDPFPIFTFEGEGVEIRKVIFMVHGENTTVVEYEVEAPQALRDRMRLEIRPLTAFRDYHSTAHENSALRTSMRVQPEQVVFTPYGDAPSLYLAHDANEVDTAGGWFHRFQYRVERERGLDFEEDLYNPFTLTARFAGRSRLSLLASTSSHSPAQAAEYRQSEIKRRRTLLSTVPAPGADPGSAALIEGLTLAADQYIAARGEQKTVLAGYPWFSDWGRDTMIALPGLTLTTGRPEIARGIIDAFAQHISQGMLPNRFPDAGEEPEYNTVDATLWYFEAIRAWLEATGDAAYVRNNWYNRLVEIIDWHEKGTRHGIRLDTDGLLHSGEPGVQLTWMDAKVGDWVVTPRQGKAVEIQALWYNALRVMEDLAMRFGNAEQAQRFAAFAGRAKQSFAAQFWNPSAQCLYDVLQDDGNPDASLRPNQIFAVSLPHTMLEAVQEKLIVEAVERELLTPVGLRTLPRNDSRYVPHYQGGVYERDSAYHQGTVWPWLMGPFITAYLKVKGGNDTDRRQCAEWLKPFLAHLSEAGLGQVSEIFDAEPPHAPRGCFAQAWSVAELLRVAMLVQGPRGDSDSTSKKSTAQTKARAARV